MGGVEGRVGTHLSVINRFRRQGRPRPRVPPESRALLASEPA